MHQEQLKSSKMKCRRSQKSIRLAIVYISYAVFYTFLFVPNLYWALLRLKKTICGGFFYFLWHYNTLYKYLLGFGMDTMTIWKCLTYLLLAFASFCLWLYSFFLAGLFWINLYYFCRFKCGCQGNTKTMADSLPLTKSNESGKMINHTHQHLVNKLSPSRLFATVAF